MLVNQVATKTSRWQIPHLPFDQFLQTTCNFIMISSRFVRALWCLQLPSLARRPAISRTAKPAELHASMFAGQPAATPASQPGNQPDNQPGSQPAIRPASQPANHPARQPNQLEFMTYTLNTHPRLPTTVVSGWSSARTHKTHFCQHASSWYLKILQHHLEWCSNILN